MRASLLAACVVSGLAAPAAARTLAVPAGHATLQDALDAAIDGDEIRVAAGRHCGAEVRARVTIVGVAGARVVGCDAGPKLAGALRVGLLLREEAASGTMITGLTFDGAGVSDDDVGPLAFGVLGRFADDVVVTRNRFLGTVQAVTNTAGDRWTITHNQVSGLGAFGGRWAGGGAAIVVQDASGDLARPGGSLNPRNRPDGNTVAENLVDGTVPDRLSAFSMAGVLVLTADRTVVFGNRVAIAESRDDNPSAGVVVGNRRASGGDPGVPGARATSVEDNDGSGSRYAVWVDATRGANREDLIIEGNQGEVLLGD